MLKCCEVCTKLEGKNYSECVTTCGKCKECNKYDMTPYAMAKPELDPFKGHRWTKGKQTMISDDTRFMIKKLYSTGKYTQMQLAKLYSVSQNTIHKIVKEV